MVLTRRAFPDVLPPYSYICMTAAVICLYYNVRRAYIQANRGGSHRNAAWTISLTLLDFNGFRQRICHRNMRYCTVCFKQFEQQNWEEAPPLKLSDFLFCVKMPN